MLYYISPLNQNVFVVGNNSDVGFIAGLAGAFVVGIILTIVIVLVLIGLKRLVTSLKYPNG